MSDILTSRSYHSEHASFEDKPLRLFPIRWKLLDEITPHEEVNQPDLDSFCRSFRKKGLFYKPILIDKESGTILDGTHRWAGLRELGTTKAPVIPFDYLGDDEIVVDTWYPFTSVTVNVIRDFLDEIDVSHCETNADYSQTPLKHPVLISNGIKIEIQENPVKLFHQLEETFDFQYTDNPKNLCDLIPDGGCGFLRKAPDKETVVNIAQSGKHVPPKYTCHRFPYKYPHIMARYEELVPGE